ncbi:velvet factor-domain-containing protein [Dichotomocladium elegans]|nr:velvet factor-domain-containing protein [Dichotomocladium elegans]
MQWLGCSDDDVKKSLQSPFYFLVANIVKEDDPSELLLPSQDYLSGSTVSSLHRLRDIDNTDGGFFVFGDLAVKKEGKYKLHFSLFEIVEGTVQTRTTLLSNTFTTYLPKRFPGTLEATFLSRTFCDQGVKMRIRKEHRITSGTSRKRKLEKDSDSNCDASAPKTTQECMGRRFKEIHQGRTPSLDDSSCDKRMHYGSWHSIPSPQQQQQHHHFSNTYSSSNRSSSTRECYIGYMHHTTSIQIPSPPPSVSSHTTMSSECFNQYCHPLVSNSPPYSTIASGVLPKTPPPLLTDPHRHHINNSSSSSCSHSMKVTLPSLHDIIAGTLPNASRRLPAPIPAPSSSPIMNRMPNHHLLSSFPSHHQHPSL